VWSPRGERPCAPEELELSAISAKENPLSSESSDALLGHASFSSVTSEDELRPSRMFRDRDSRGLTGMKQIGKGSFGIVSEAIWKRGGENGQDLRVAVKELELNATEETPMAKEMMRDLLKEFRKEVEICVSLDHPNLVKFYGYTQEDPYENKKGKGKILHLRIIQELMRGGALDHLLYTENWKPRIVQTLKMSKDIANAMVYLHAIGETARDPIIHRDLKSPNLLLVEYPPKDDIPVVKITDFGLARQKDVRDNEETEDFRASLAGSEESQEQARRTQMMTGCGTLYWMAPEVLKGDVYNEAVDVYAFAMCMWEMVAGEVPWQSVAAPEVPFKVAIEKERPVRRTFGC
jgi:serine/threonine protein kinase